MTWRRFSHSILTKLVLLGLALVSTAVVVRYFVLADFIRQDLSQVVAEQQRSLAQYAAADVDQKIVQRQVALQSLAQRLPQELLAHPAELQTWLMERQAHMPLFSSVVVSAPEGRALATVPPQAVSEATDLRWAASNNPTGTDTLRVGRPSRPSPDAEPQLPLSVPLLGAQGEPMAWLTGITSLRASGFLDTLMAERSGTSSSGFLVVSPQDGLFVASSRPDMVLKPTPPPGVNPLHDRAMQGFRGTGVTRNADGVEEIAAIATVPSTGWFVVARIPSQEALGTVTRVQHFLVRNALLSLVVFTLLFSIAVYVLMRPSIKAAERADQMTLGAIPLEPLPVQRDDEIGHLLTAFNRLLTKLDAQQTELVRLAHHDPLTGLPNRARLEERLEKSLHTAHAAGRALVLMYLDLDGFKPINDTHGHAMGDRVLREIALRFSQVIRAGDTLARVGGDEFVAVITDLPVPGQEAAESIAQQFISCLAAPFDVGGAPCRVGVSIGLATGQGCSSTDELLRAADQAMYRAKEAGRGRWSWAPPTPAA